MVTRTEAGTLRDTARAGATESAPPVPWPPPGLARLQGDTLGAAGWLAAGGFLILPLLWAVAARQDPWSLGPLGETIWLALGLGIIGVPVVLGGYVVLVRLLIRGARAMEWGHAWKTVALVAADPQGDAGLLLQGSTHFRLLSPKMRRRLALNRIIFAGLLLAASVWLTFGFGLAVILAARGILSAIGMAALTFGPAVVMGGIGVLQYAWEEGMLRRVRKRWHGRPGTDREAREEIRAWTAAMAEQAPAVIPADPPERGGRIRTGLRAAAVAMAALGAVALIPILTLVMSAAVLPVLARITAPDLSDAITRYAATEALRDYTVEPDPSITPTEAGEAYHALLFVGRPYRASGGVLPPVRTYEEPWLARDSSATTPLSSVVDDAARRVGDRLEPEFVATLAGIADHPAQADIARLARAPAIDVAGTRWSMPLPSDLSLSSLAMPPFGALRQATYAGLARAAVQADRGETEAADTTLRQLISVGLLLADHGPTVLDHLMGVVTASMAGDALESLYSRTGHPDAERLADSRRAAVRGVARGRAGVPDDPANTLRMMPTAAVDSLTPPGVRWEYLNLLNTISPCMNLQRAVFGPDQQYDDWLEQARAGLVETEADAEFFDLARGGMIGRQVDEPPNFATRFLGITMGGTGRPGSCARVFGEMVGF
jgi:hypothetical protein